MLRRSKKSYSSARFGQPLAFLDMIFNMMMSFAFLFVLSFILINISKKHDAEVKKPKAEMLLTMTWPNRAVEDMDLWLMLPNRQRVWFRGMTANLISLERDDRGLLNDFSYDDKGGYEENPINKEVITFRGLPPGRYYVSVQFYSMMNDYRDLAKKIYGPLPKLPYPIEVELMKLNPSVREIFHRSVMIHTKGEEVPVFAFTITKDGKITDIQTEGLPNIVDETGGSTGQEPPPTPLPPSGYGQGPT